MPKKKKKQTSSSAELLRVATVGGTADGKGTIYSGSIGNFPLGNVLARNQSAARKKLLIAARRYLK